MILRIAAYFVVSSYIKQEVCEIAVEIQLSLFESIMDRLYLKPLFILGVFLIGLILFLLIRKEKKLPKFRIVAGSILLYYYVCIVFKNVVGIATISDFIRVIGYGDSIFSPNINLALPDNGLSLEFLLNVFCFIPFGFLCPIISRTYKKIINMVLLGFGLSLTIEISQLFTQYRATDINDLIANVLGTIIGFLCFKLISLLVRIFYKEGSPSKKDPTRFLPALIVVTAYGITLIS